MIILVLYLFISFLFVGLLYWVPAQATAGWFWACTVFVFLQIWMIMSESVPTPSPRTVSSSQNSGITWLIVLVSPIVLHQIALLAGRVGFEVFGRYIDNTRFWILAAGTFGMIVVSLVAKQHEYSFPSQSAR